MTESSPRRILGASLTALALAIVLLVTVVLPAEYGWDPLGSGRWLGVMGFAEKGPNPLQAQGQDWRIDRISFELQPFESVEYKYRVEQGAGLLYDWQASGEVLFDMHSEPDGAAPGYAESFAKSRAVAGKGSFTAPFSGVHGWFWQNRGSEVVVVTLAVNGFFEYSQQMSGGHTYRHEFKEVPEQPAATSHTPALTSP